MFPLWDRNLRNGMIDARSMGVSAHEGSQKWYGGPNLPHSWPDSHMGPSLLCYASNELGIQASSLLETFPTGPEWTYSIG